MGYIQSTNRAYSRLRLASAADTPLDDQSRKLGALPQGAVEIDERINLVEIAAIFGGSATAATINIYGLRQAGMAVKVCSFDATAGDVAAMEDQLFAKEIDNISWTWFDEEKVSNGGDIARLLFDAYGLRHLFAEVQSLTGTGTVEIIYSGV